MWYLADGQDRVGPFTVDEMRARFQAGHLGAESYVWREGQKNWVHASDVDELCALFPANETAEGPPPIPSPVPSGVASQLRALRSASSNLTMRDLADRVTDAVGVERLQNFSLKQVFSQALRHHDESELEDYFTVGTRGTTPSLLDVSTAWPALWNVRNGQPVTFETLKDKRFFSVLCAAVILHAIWNMPFAGPFWAKYWILGGVAWVLVFSYVQMGLRQVGRLQSDTASSVGVLAPAH